MHKVVKVVLKGYREWTEEIGDDREWKIQRVQSELEKRATEIAAERGAFYLPTRKDVLVFIANNTDVEDWLKPLEGLSPVPLEVLVGCGKTPLEALLKAEPCSQQSEIAAIHFDINFISKKDHYLGYVEAMEMTSSLLHTALGFKSIGGYLGGDNAVFFSDPLVAKEFAETMSSIYDVKVGIGVALKPRKALELAARALRNLRKERSKRVEELKG